MEIGTIHETWTVEPIVSPVPLHTPVPAPFAPEQEPVPA